MIDGVKIDCSKCQNLDWLNNKYLKFSTSVSLQTGDILSNKQIAKYRGLIFSITQSIEYKNRLYFEVRGSLHKYFNKGKHNANDFNFNDLQTVIYDLQHKFNIDTETAILRNLEFGVNIYIPIPVNELLKNLVSYKTYSFGTLNIKGVKVGKAIYQTKQRTKVYNKGKQYNKTIKNLLRFEIAINKMEQIKQTKIQTLSDLQIVDKFNPLSMLLVEFWNDIIYFDKKALKYKLLTNWQQKKILSYATPQNWLDYNKKQRYRAKIRFNNLMNEFNTSTIHNEISQLIDRKSKELTAVICPPLDKDFKPNLKSKMSTFGQLEYTIQKYPNQPQKKELKFRPKNTLKKADFKTKKKNPKKCKSCFTDISQKRPNAKFCNKKCNNKYHGRKRTKKRQFIILTEKGNLQKLVKILNKNRLLLLVTYKTTTGTYSDNLHQYEINTTPDWIKKIVSVSVTGYRKNSKTIVLTSYRARKLIKSINQINIKK